MTMPRINLIPTPRLEARRRRTHRRQCVAGCVAYGLAVLAGTAACHALWGRTDSHLTEQLAEAAGDIDRAEKAVAAVRTDLGSAQATLKASRSIAEQPDWSTLLALLAARAGDEVVLKDCSVRPREVPAEVRAPAAPPDPKRPAAKAGANAAPPPEPVMVVTLSGRGLSQQAVSQFVLRLEETRLFGKVNLIDTSREVADIGDAIGFRLECSLDDPGPAAARRGGPVGAVGRKPAVASAVASAAAPPAAGGRGGVKVKPPGPTTAPAAAPSVPSAAPTRPTSRPAVPLPPRPRATRNEARARAEAPSRVPGRNGNESRGG